jgi:hypothetical protein
MYSFGVLKHLMSTETLVFKSVNIVRRVDTAAVNNRLTNALTSYCHIHIKLCSKWSMRNMQRNCAILNRDHPRFPSSVALRRCRCSVAHRAPSYFHISLLYLSLTLDLNSPLLLTQPGSPAYCNVWNVSASLLRTHTRSSCVARKNNAFPGCGISWVNFCP